MANNPMMGQLNATKMTRLLNNMSRIRQSVAGVEALGDKEKAINYLISKNPQFKQAVDYVNAHGGNAKEACHQIIRDNGFDPQELENALVG